MTGAPGPLQEYRNLVASGGLEPDAQQSAVVAALQTLHDQLAGSESRGGFLQKLLQREAKAEARCIYIHGDVGRGKSMLMDMFFSTSEGARKRRVHFHEFMLEVHGEIHAWRQLSTKDRAQQGHGDDPIPPVAEKIAGTAALLCFDEFQVTDVADAMILSRLFTHLLDLGVVFVATSNKEPQTLYEGGLNRGLFLPFIEMILDRFDVLHIRGDHDYRLERLNGAPVYYSPLGPTSRLDLNEAFMRLTDLDQGSSESLLVQGRTLKVPEAAKGVARFQFDDLCARALGAADYLAIAWHYHTVVLANVPIMGPGSRNEARRFVTLIDTLYDNHVKLICSAEGQPHELYEKGDGRFEFGRTVSRLMEMQSAEYLAAGHAV